MIAAGSAALLSSSANGTTLIDSFSQPNPLDQPVTFTIGYEFITRDIEPLVTHLGYWDEDEDGLPSEVIVGLFSSQGDLLRNVTLSSGTGASLVDGFRYVGLDSPLMLSAGTRYILGAYIQPGTSYSAGDTIEGVHFTTSPGFDVSEERASMAGQLDLNFPDEVYDQNEAFIGPNLQYVVVPEVSSSLLALAGLVSLGLIRRRN